jgi:hypothetical protein
MLIIVLLKIDFLVSESLVVPESMDEFARLNAVLLV